MKLKSIGLIFIMYVVACALGYLGYALIPNLDLVLRILIADVIATIVIYIFSLVFKNASVYDPYWSVIPPIIILFLMIEQQNFGFNMWLLFSVMMVWAIRLTYNWAKLFGGLSSQDWRYDQIKAFNPKLFFLTSFTGIMLFPTLIVFVQLIPVAELAGVSQNVGFYSILGAVIVLLATLLEWLSDSTMQKFKKDNPGKIINVGVWKWSRHPNYLGEIMVWFGLYFFHVDAFGLTYNIIYPIAMFLMFLVISIPMMERKLLKKYPEYKKHKKKVAVLVPFIGVSFRKHED